MKIDDQREKENPTLGQIYFEREMEKKKKKEPHTGANLVFKRKMQK